MLVQSLRREVSEHDAWFQRTMLRHERFSIAVLSSSGIANDYGLLMHAVTYLARFGRSQLVILLAGRGYFASEGRTIPWHRAISSRAISAGRLRRATPAASARTAAARADRVRAIASAPEPLVRAYGALGDALSHLDTQPNLNEIADTLG